MTARTLGGLSVLVTRPERQAGDLATAIEAAGGTAVRFPVLRIEGRETAGVARDLQALPAADIAIFTSRNAVDHGLAPHWHTAARIAVIGPATRLAVETAGRQVDIVADSGYDSESLLRSSALQQVSGRNILIVRGEDGRETLATVLRKRGARVDYLAVYRRLPEAHTTEDIERLRRLWLTDGIHAVTVMSVESFDHLWTALPADVQDALRMTPLVTPSRRVIQTVREKIPGAPAFLATGPQAADMLRALTAAIVPGTRNERET